MNCLRIDQVYLYLEKEFSLGENKNIEEHLSSCLKCKKAVEERKLLLEAAESLPLWQTPPDFTRQVMARIFPEKVHLRSWLTALATGFSAIILLLSVFFLLSGQNPLNFFVSLSHSLLNFVRNLSTIFVKFIKLLSVVIKIVTQLSEYILKGLAHLTSIISPEVQITLITLTLILSAFLLYGVSRIFLTGEKA